MYIIIYVMIIQHSCEKLLLKSKRKSDNPRQNVRHPLTIN